MALNCHYFSPQSDQDEKTNQPGDRDEGDQANQPKVPDDIYEFGTDLDVTDEEMCSISQCEPTPDKDQEGQAKGVREEVADPTSLAEELGTDLDVTDEELCSITLDQVFKCTVSLTFP